MSDGVLKEHHRPAQPFASAFVPEVAALQVEIVRLQIRRRGLDAHQRALQRRRDRTRDLVLHREDAFQLAVVRVRPQMIAVADADQLRGDTQRVPFASDAAFEERTDLQFLAQFADAQVLSAQREYGRARGDAEPLDVGQRVDQLLGDAVGEVVALLVAAHVHERQHGDRRRRAHGPGGAAHDKEVQ